MSATIPRCVNHPDVETRISCTSCGNPICTRCMRQGAVGQKCPDCAKVPRHARGIGKPRHYVLGAAVGLGVALVGGAIAAFARGIPFVGFFVSVILGYAIGSAISWAVQRQTAPPFVAMAAIAGALGGFASYLVAGYPLFSPFSLLGVALTALFSVTALRR